MELPLRMKAIRRVTLLIVNGLPIVSATHGYHENLSNQTDDHLNATVYILFTSGTSGLPKACPSHEQEYLGLVYGFHRTLPAFLHKPDNDQLSSSHSMGLSSMIHVWIHGATAVVPSPAFDARRTLEAIEKMNCTHLAGVQIRD